MKVHITVQTFNDPIRLAERSKVFRFKFPLSECPVKEKDSQNVNSIRIQNFKTAVIKNGWIPWDFLETILIKIIQCMQKHANKSKSTHLFLLFYSLLSSSQIDKAVPPAPMDMNWERKLKFTICKDESSTRRPETIPASPTTAPPPLPCTLTMLIFSSHKNNKDL